MATKRTTAYIHPSRRDNVPSEPRRKRQKPNNAGPKSFKKAHPVNELKSQIRSLKRLLERNERLPADVRVEKERALQTARHELEEAQKSQQRNDIIGRYHKIRFFDRQKADRRLRRARKELNECEEGGDNHSVLQKRVQNAQVDVNYALYYPLDQHYVSLFPRRKANDQNDEENEDGSNDDAASAERKGDSQMWEKVKMSMANGTLDALRNGKLTNHDNSAVVNVERHKANEDVGSGPRRAGSKAASNKKSGEPIDVGEESESDGFFES